MMEPPLSVLGTRRTPAPEPPAPGQTRGLHSPRAIFQPLSPGAEPTTAQADWLACSLCRPGGRAEATGKCPGDSTPPGRVPSHGRLKGACVFCLPQGPAQPGPAPSQHVRASSRSRAGGYPVHKPLNRAPKLFPLGTPFHFRDYLSTANR